eukprot:6503986-Lingulodinium_polyedra.AAC.1
MSCDCWGPPRPAAALLIAMHIFLRRHPPATSRRSRLRRLCPWMEGQTVRGEGTMPLPRTRRPRPLLPPA